MNIPKTGQAASVGLMVTKTLVILGDPQVTAPPGRPRGAMLRAYNKQTGAQVGEVWMPAPQSGSPMTYSVDGRQYIIIAISGGNYSGEYLAFALPQNEMRRTDTAAGTALKSEPVGDALQGVPCQDGLKAVPLPNSLPPFPAFLLLLSISLRLFLRALSEGT